MTLLPSNALSGALVAALVLAPLAAVAKESPALDLARQLNQAFIEVADQVSPAVVVIRVAHKAPQNELDEDSPFWEFLPRQFRRQLEEQRERQRQQREERKEEKGESSREPVFDGQGSGVVIREEGYILTNRHVVDGADKIKVRFKDGAEFDAEVRGVDAQSDVAVIKIDPKGRKLAVARLGDSDKARVGEFAIAIGAPFELDYSVTFGHVSAKGRTHIINDPNMDQDFLQTDANINPGNSGGPLVNIAGEVIGINTLIRGLRTGIGFAIPVNLAREVADKLITDGKFVRSYLGVRIVALKEAADFRGMVSGINDGVVVMGIPPDGPAARSDLKAADVITAVDGKTVSTPQQLRNEIRRKPVGQTVTLDVHRAGKTIKVKVKTDAWPDEPTPVVTRREPPPPETQKTLGMTVQPLTKELADQYGVAEKTAGVIVTEVAQGSPAERKGLRPGDIITEVNQKAVTTPKQFRDALKGADLKKGVILNFISRGTSKFEILKESGE
jgi:serine protease Do